MSHNHHNNNSTTTYHYANATHCHVINPNAANNHHHQHHNASGGQRRQNSSSARTSSTGSSPGSGGSQCDGPLAIFTPCSNSHPFEERCIPVTRSEEQAVKIGRAVVRFQPAPNNAIFDCKVLSRNHAILWFNGENFLIKDTRSSNGTFVNNERLSNSGEDSQPRALYSGDILQLGVEIVDNAKKVASGCVTCIVSLMDERGEECRRPPSSAATGAAAAAASLAANGGAALQPSAEGAAGGASIERLLLENEQLFLKYTLVPNDKLFIMDQYMKEARFRENALGAKLQSLEEQLAGAQEALESSWQALINEEHLLSRIEILESQLALFAANNKQHNVNSSSVNAKCEKVKGVEANGEADAANDENASATKKNSIAADVMTARKAAHDEKIRGEIQEVYEDRAKAELAAKDALRKAEEEVFETTMRLHDAESSLLNLEGENAHLHRQCRDFEAELTRQRASLEEAIEDMAKPREKYVSDLAQRDAEIADLQAQLAAARAECDAMAAAELKKKNKFDGSRRSSTNDFNRSVVKNTKADESAAELDDQTEGRRNDDDAGEIKAGEDHEGGDESLHDEANDGDAEEEYSSFSASSTAAAASSQRRRKRGTESAERSKTDSNTTEGGGGGDGTAAENYGAARRPSTSSSDEQSAGGSVPSVSFIGGGRCESRCECGRSILTNNICQEKQKHQRLFSTSTDVQILLISTLPFLILVIALLFPLLRIWPNGGGGGRVEGRGGASAVVLVAERISASPPPSSSADASPLLVADSDERDGEDGFERGDESVQDATQAATADPNEAILANKTDDTLQN